MAVAAGRAGPAAASHPLLFMMGQCCCLKKIFIVAADQKKSCSCGRGDAVAALAGNLSGTVL